MVIDQHNRQLHGAPASGSATRYRPANAVFQPVPDQVGAWPGDPVSPVEDGIVDLRRGAGEQVAELGKECDARITSCRPRFQAAEVDRASACPSLEERQVTGGRVRRTTIADRVKARGAATVRDITRIGRRLASAAVAGRNAPDTPVSTVHDHGGSP
jgi:hypothetical protein